MKNSGISSPTTPTTHHNGFQRKQFALKGRSVHLDPVHNAVRPDLADVRLAASVFAPHYAAPLAMTVAAPASLRVAPGGNSEPLGSLEAGDRFDMLDISGGVAWGIAPRLNLVGYIDHALLALAGDAGSDASTPAA